MRKILFLFVLSFLQTSCLKDVEFSPTDRYTQSLAFKNTENVNLYLNSFYPLVRTYGQLGDRAMGNNSNLSDGLTDILKYGAIVAGAGDCNLIMTVDGTVSVSSNHFDTWTNGYTQIRRINEFLDGLKTYGGHFSESQRAAFEAEAKFFRSYLYFLIMRAHASVTDDLGVIIYDDINSQNVANKNRGRANVSDSWDFIWSDMDFAAKNLPEKANARGRLNKYAANALQARAMLYAERYDLAKQAVVEIEKAGIYEYEPDYASIFESSDNKEVIWSYDFAINTLTHSFDAKYALPGDIASSGGYAGPTQDFVDMFDYANGTPFAITDTENRFITDENVDNRDPRLKACVLYNQATWKERQIACYEGGVDQKYMPYGSVNAPGNTVTGYYMRKLLDESNTNYVADGSYQPWIEFRYAEMQLIKAECLAKESDFSGARTIINDLRKVRFGREDVVTASITSWESALDVILKERCIELCYEGHRFWDLRRTGRAAKVLNNKKYSGVFWRKSGDKFTPELVSCEMGARKYPEKFNRFPIPQAEVSNNTNVKQNSGW